MEALKRATCFLFILISGCSEVIPIKLSESEKVYVGVWHYFHKVETDNRFDFKKIIIRINSDSTAVYKTCSVVVKKESSATSSSRSSVFLDSAVVTLINQNEISLVQETEIMNLNYDLTINKKPYEESGVWKMVIDNELLSRVELSNLTEWNCPETENIKFGVEKT